MLTKRHKRNVMSTTLDETRLLAMPEEDYMNQQQRAFFEAYLQRLRNETRLRLAEARAGIEGRRCWGDAMDRAVAEGNQTFLLRQAERDTERLGRIDAALERLRHDEYGYCLESGEAIGLERLLLDPAAKYTRAVQSRHERTRH
ncbi:TraR/DksA family transcriptional regulator [Modicisalibacter xianhensis]|uniref:TraR/DksA family transcriptional regulator n=2 Tax=Modicisalibacter xianhensis TaxID=442341 RepID=A0A4R8FUH2_9GAMM|nr:TraR/DksA family transcriptional regulator [Halomonas xianhensis]